MSEQQENSQDEFLVHINARSFDGEIDLNEKLFIPSIDTMTPARLANLLGESVAIHARWSVLANEAAHKYDDVRIEFEVWEKGRLKNIREETILDSKKKQTEKTIEEVLMSDPEYIRKYRNVLDYKERAANVKTIAQAFGEKADRLVNISSLMKSEMNKSRQGVLNDDD